MSVYYLLGQANSGKSTYLCQKALELCKDSKKNIIMIVPEQFALKTESDLIKMSDAHGIMNIEVLSFSRLAYRIMEEACDSAYPVLDDMGKTMLIKTILRENADNLSVYKRKDNNISFVDEVKSCVSELMSYMISPDKLMPAKDSNDLLSHKRADMTLVYSKFLEKIDGMYTTAESLATLCFKHISSSKVLAKSIIMLDGFTGFTPVQYAFLEHLLGVCSDMYVSLSADNEMIKSQEVAPDDYKDYDGLFSMTAEVLRKLTKLANDNGYYAKIIDFEEFKANGRAIDHLRHNIFRHSYAKNNDNDGIYIDSFTGKKEEAYYVAAKIAELLRKEDCHFGDFAVICGDIASYEYYLRRAFDDYKINYYMDETRGLDKNILISFIHNAIKIIDSNYSKEAVINFIKSPLAGYDFKTINEFENYLNCYNYRGLNRYKQPFSYVSRLKTSVDMSEINNLRVELVNRMSMLPDKLEKMDVHEFIVSLYKFMESFKVSDKLDKLSEEAELNKLTMSDEIVKEHGKVYDEIIKLLERIDQLSDGAPMSYKEFDDLFMMGVKKLKLGLLPASNDVVLVGDVKRSRLKDIKTLFFLGVNEGVIPAVGKESLIFSAGDKTKMLEEGIELASVVKNDPYREEFYVYLALSKPAKRLYMTYVTADADGSELRPSYVVGQIKNIFPKLAENSEPRSLGQKIGFDNGLSYYIEHEKTNDELYKKLKAYYKNIGGYKKEMLSRMDQMINGPLINLSEKIANKLYGEILNGSVTKLEDYSKCHYKFFMRYGLCLQDNGDAEPNNIDFGNVFHKALADFGKYLNENTSRYDSITETEIVDKSLGCISHAVNEYAEGLYCEDERLAHSAERMENVMEITAKALFAQLKAGAYVPTMFEKHITMSGLNYNLDGKLDRIDILESEEGKKIKIVDYKTGSKEFSYVELLEGVSLQLPVYMNAAMELIDKSTPGALFYQSVDNDLIDCDIADAVDKKIKELRPKGIGEYSTTNLLGLDRDSIGDDSYVASYNSDVIRYRTTKTGSMYDELIKGKKWIDDASMALVIGYANDKVDKLSKEIIKGNIDINPYKDKKGTACDYCSYRGICAFDKKVKKYAYREINTSEEKAFNIIAGIEEEEG